jgi:hypothetical protein
MMAESLGRSAEEEGVISWRESPFETLYNQPASTKGFNCERFLACLMSESGLHVGPRRDATHDFIVNGFRVELKTAFLTTCNNGANRVLMWTSIRRTGFDYLALFGVFPHEAQLWVFEREQFFRLFKGDNQKYADNAGVSFGYYIDSPPEWMDGNGGTLEEGIEVLTVVCDDSDYQLDLFAGHEITTPL